VAKFESGTFRPFIQGGLNHRLHYRNEVDVEGVTFSFDDADTIYFARAGIDFDLGRHMQAYVAVRGDVSDSFEAISAQLGVTFKLD
jgi:outer membrane autotransporter protein